MKYFSMFSGIGGFELGIQQALPDAECVGFTEVDKYAISIYKKHFKGHHNYGDATRIIPSELPDFQLLVGGFPCQAFSLAGKRRGFGDTRGTLFFEIERVLKEKRPRLLVLENVKGLLSHDEGRSISVISATLDELGYDLQWDVCNSKNHGVPQNRERIFIVGHLRATGQSAKQIFPLTKGNRQSSSIPENNKIMKVGNVNPSGNGANGNVFDVKGLSPTITTNKGEGVKTICFNSEKGINPDVMISRNDGVSYALTKTHANHAVLTNQRIRRLMPIECERLQGFPDNWTKYGCDGKEISDSQRYKCCGNAVTVNVVASIFKHFTKF